MKNTSPSRKPPGVRGDSAPAALRTFIAVELDAEARRQLKNLQVNLQPLVQPGLVRWVAPENIHITLKFLGETRPDQVAAVSSALDSLGPTILPFRVTLAGRGCFPNFKRPHVVWAGLVDRGQRLQKLADAVERSISPLGWPTETRPFTPHLTIARISDSATSRERALLGAAIEQFEVGDLSTLAVSAITFIRSDLQPGGPVYTVLREVKLSAG